MTPLVVTTTQARPRRSIEFHPPDPRQRLAWRDLDEAPVAAFDQCDPIIDFAQHPAFDRRRRRIGLRLLRFPALGLLIRDAARAQAGIGGGRRWRRNRRLRQRGLEKSLGTRRGLPLHRLRSRAFCSLEPFYGRGKAGVRVALTLVETLGDRSKLRREVVLGFLDRIQAFGELPEATRGLLLRPIGGLFKADGRALEGPQIRGHAHRIRLRALHSRGESGPVDRGDRRLGGAGRRPRHRGDGVPPSPANAEREHQSGGVGQRGRQTARARRSLHRLGARDLLRRDSVFSGRRLRRICGLGRSRGSGWDFDLRLVEGGFFRSFLAVAHGPTPWLFAHQ